MIKIETSDSFAFVNREDVVSFVVKYDGSTAWFTISKNHYSQTFRIEGKEQIEDIYNKLQGENLCWEREYEVK